MRYSEYKHYLRTLDEITSASRQDMEKFMHETVAETFNTIITEPEESDAALIELNSALLSMSSNMQQTFAKAEGELHGLKLVASEELLDMVNEYVELQRDILNESVEMMENWQEVDLDNPMASVSGEVRRKGEQAQELYQEILHKMRSELDLR